MILCPFEVHPDRGGAHRFAAALFARLAARGEEVRFRDRPDGSGAVVFANSFLTPACDVRRFWAAGHPVLLRLDGSAYAYGRFDDADARQAAVARYADRVVYQSAFCRDVLRRYWVTDAPGEVIPNGVDTELFRPDGPRDPAVDPDRPAVLFAAHSRLLLKGLRAFVHLAHQCPQARFYVAARPSWDALPAARGGGLPANLTVLGPLARDRLARVLRSVDVFSSPARNDPAPNVVLEALSSGLPVWHAHSGGVPELVGPCGRVITHDPNQDLNALLAERTALGQRARRRAQERFDLDLACDRYLAAIRALADTAPRRRPRLARVRTRLARTRADRSRLRVGVFTHVRARRPRRYHEVRASAWIRAFQLVRPLARHGIRARLDPRRVDGLDLAVLADRPTDQALATADRLGAANVPFVWDLVTNTLDAARVRVPAYHIDAQTVERAHGLLARAAAVSAVSPWLADRAAALHPLTRCIPDAVPEAWFRSAPRGEPRRWPLTLGYAGTADKAAMLAPWWRHARKLGCQLVVIADRPAEGLAGARFVPWRYAAFPRTCRDVDLALAPHEDLHLPYNRGHSAFKIDAFLAQGIPVVASPVPAYRAALADADCGALVDSPEAFAEALAAYRRDPDALVGQGRRAIACARARSVARVAEQWNAFLRGVLVWREASGQA